MSSRRLPARFSLGRLLGWLSLLCLFTLPAAQAHESHPAYLEITETAPDQYSVLWRTPELAGRPLPLALTLPEGVRNLREPIVQELTDSRVERRWIDAGSVGLAGKRITFTGLQFTITDVLARVQLQDGRSWTVIARPAEPWIEITAALSGWQVASEYIAQGISHILFGPDHLLFVLGLLLIVRHGWSLVKTITAFTVAHSMTLTAATLGYLSLPGPPLEAAIALSILFLSLEIVRRWRGETSFTIRHPWVVAFAFGLLHGFGFAIALSSAGLPQSDIPIALLCFNIGVEIGQLCFVGFVLALARGFRLMSMNWPRWVQVLPGYAIGSVAAFWTIERMNVLLHALL